MRITKRSIGATSHWPTVAHSSRFMSARPSRSRRSDSPSSHIRIARPAAALGRNPGDVLIRVLDVARLAVDAVLRVDHEAGLAPLLHPFVDAGRAIARRGTGVAVVLGGLLQRGIGHLEMH